MDPNKFAAPADLCVVGSGVAGLSAALTAAEAGATVRLITAGPALSGSSRWAQGGIAAAIGPTDYPELHEADTLAVGGDLNDEAAVHVLVTEGQRVMRRLLRSGMPFDGGAEHPDLGLEAGHGRRRILHAGGGATGERVSSTLLLRALAHPCITLVAETPVDQLTLAAGRVTGVVSRGQVLPARAVLLATGGYAGLWGRTTNPPENHGLGLSLAWQAGAALADLEFVQFHPTALALPEGPTYLLTEALRGEGARLVDSAGQEVVNPLLARDVVARAIARHLATRGPVYLTLRDLDPAFIAQRFPNILAGVAAYGLDLTRDLLPVAPAAHYCMGGVRTDTWGRSGVPGLYVAGEAACTGAQGANRLASNSMLECLVFGERAARVAIADCGLRIADCGMETNEGRLWQTVPLEEAIPATQTASRFTFHVLRFTPADLPLRLDRDLGVERDGARLGALLADVPDPDAPDCPSEGRLAALATRAALLRAESRGAHYRTDTPTSDPAWRGRIHWRRDCAPQFERIVD
ncbi:MAG: FAD-dependent oxidoreductase [Chloroflexota bacterium]|nr:FAD-dependent oxidoreductase [Chloroflexota bacterium]